MMNTPIELLSAVYSQLDLDEGVLRVAMEEPRESNVSADDWVDHGDWLALAHRVGAARVFFVKQDPVIVFTEVDSLDESKLLEAHRRAWCLARPQCLFIAAPGELRVYSLTTPPARNLDDWSTIEPLAIVNKAAEVAEVLRDFQRSSVESGALFEQRGFGQLHQRADQRLIADLRQLRRVLLAEGLKAPHAHALIGRAIFIRYLEDRGILSRSYYAAVAKQNPKWERLLSEPPEKAVIASLAGVRFFDRVLRDKAFTYALFNQLADDFNGDMFPRDAVEQRVVQSEHLRLLRHFLLGDTSVEQYSLFFWAYDFSIVPLELISSIYEEFYHESHEDEKGTHYTPLRLVADVLTRTLPIKILATGPKVLDPACGSGIFLVEAFKRIVRYRSYLAGRPLTNDELGEILRTQITGIEVNPEAVRVAAFSLYLALLNFKDPPSIRASRRLPHLVNDASSPAGRGLNTLICANAFAPTVDERERLATRLSDRQFAGRKTVSAYMNLAYTLPFPSGHFDVVIGNPPWDEVRTEVRPRRVRTVARKPVQNGDVGKTALSWAAAFQKEVGDRSNSQLFIHRAISLTKRGGSVGLLVHGSVLFNQREPSKEFRAAILRTVKVEEVLNFSQVRRLYFDHAVAPFIFLRLTNSTPDLAYGRFVYSTARLTRLALQLHSGVLNATDRRIVSQGDFLERDYLWKTYAWGSHRDAALMGALDTEPRLVDHLGEARIAGYGFQRGSLPASATLRRLPTLSSANLVWYGPLLPQFFEDRPTRVSYTPDERLYSGQRLLAVRGIKGDLGICTRLESKPFSFRHTVYCIHLGQLTDWQAKVAIGLTWSSLGRYRVFMKSGSWGLWYDQTVAEDWLNLPLRLANEPDIHARRIVSLVDAIRSNDAVEERLDGTKVPVPPSSELRRKLNHAIFDLFDLADTERDLIEDWERYSFDLLMHGQDSVALARLTSLGPTLAGSAKDLDQLSESELHRYLRSFVSEWSAVLDDPDLLRWSVIAPPGSTHLAVILGSDVASQSEYSQSGEEWKSALARATQSGPLDSSALYTDGILRVVTEDYVLIAKRNERRLWTASAAREDADATLVRALRLQEHFSAHVNGVA
jgi:SAM-dependent methyltransferase